MKSFKIAVAVATLSLAVATTATARDRVQLAGSSTVLPYATIIAEAFGENTNFKTPVVEGGGSGAGRKKLCEGVGENTIDIANSSSKISKKDIDTCKANGVDFLEVVIGYDGVLFATDVNGASFKFTPSTVWKAISKEVVVNGKVVENPYTNWKEIDPSFPDQKIALLIPGTKHGTREVFDKNVLERGCKMFDENKAVAECTAIRTDGVVVEIDGDYNETISRIAANPQAVGVFGMSYYLNNMDRIKANPYQGKMPSLEGIADGSYGISRPLYIYVKKAHVGIIPGFKEFINFFVSDDQIGPDSASALFGLVPNPKLAEQQAAVAALN